MAMIRTPRRPKIPSQTCFSCLVVFCPLSRLSNGLSYNILATLSSSSPNKTESSLLLPCHNREAHTRSAQTYMQYAINQLGQSTSFSTTVPQHRRRRSMDRLFRMSSSLSSFTFYILTMNERHPTSQLGSQRTDASERRGIASMLLHGCIPIRHRAPLLDRCYASLATIRSAIRMG